MAGKKPDFGAFVSREGSDGKNYYLRIGSAWEVTNGGISIKLDALPIKGELVLFRSKDDE